MEKMDPFTIVVLLVLGLGCALLWGTFRLSVDRKYRSWIRVLACSLFLIATLYTILVLFLPYGAPTSRGGPRQYYLHRTNEMGAIAFNPPKNMIVGEEEHFKLLIGRKFLALAKGDIEPIAGGAVTRQSIILSNTMRATLLGGSDFRVVARQDDHSFHTIPQNAYATWAWDVTALHAGSLVLTMRIFAPDRRDAEGDELVKEVRIAVRGDVVGQLKAVFLQYWQWAWSALLIPVVTIVWRSWIKRRTAQRQKVSSHGKASSAIAAEQSQAASNVGSGNIIDQSTHYYGAVATNPTDPVTPKPKFQVEIIRLVVDA